MATFDRKDINRTNLAAESTKEGTLLSYEITSFPNDIGVSYSGGKGKSEFSYTKSPFCMAFFVNVNSRSSESGVAEKNKKLYDLDLVGRRGAGQAVSTNAGATTGGIVGAGIGAGIGGIGGAVAGAAIGAVAGKLAFASRKRLAETILLPMPIGLDFADNTSYGTTGIGGGAGTILSQLGNASSLMEGAGTVVGGGIQLLMQSFKTDLIKMAEKNKGLEINNLGGTIDKSLGVVSNPRVEQVFQGKEFRKFNFSWQLAPRNQAETRSIETIIKKFRMHMSPELTNGLGGAFLVMPNEFDIVFYQVEAGDQASRFKENEHLPKIATCVLTDVNVDYQPNNHWNSFEDGAVAQIVLKLAFTEVEPLYRNQIEKGF